ncbi:hypothetical protein ACFPM3_05870 [Streptomyces coeruleoprunus]|uniref:Lipoprotein n=1 Tax=Streptomyces coeruleoprunus TaxID=285563 RepID=A0ABV9X8V2_9ACTN
MRAIPVVALLALAPAVLVAGCSVPDSESGAVSAAAARFAARTGAADFRGACRMLSPVTREELAANTGPTCEKALEDAGLADPGGVRTTEVYGHHARVAFDQDTYFLAVYPDGWKVRAAGCVPRPQRPYRCRVKGD